MCGGEWPDSNPNDTFWQYSSILDEWKELCSLQIPRSELGLTIVDNFVYAIGGSTGNERLGIIFHFRIKAKNIFNSPRLIIVIIIIRNRFILNNFICLNKLL